MEGVQVTLPDGTVVLAQGLWDGASERPRPPDFALYLDEQWRDDPDVTWQREIVDWPDFGLPADEAATFAAIVDLHRRAQEGELVEIACLGGLGRTGCVLACLVVLADSSLDPVRWVRENYRRGAIEGAEQEQLIAQFAQAHAQ